MIARPLSNYQPPGFGFDPKAAARFMGNYSRHFSAGAFATPTAAEIEKLMRNGDWHWWAGVAAACRWMHRDSLRKDWAGRTFRLASGQRVITHLATEPGARLPDLGPFDWIFAYVEDGNLVDQLQAQGRELHAVRISAASEIIGCFGRAGTHHFYPPVDRATLVRVPLDVGEGLRMRVLAEVTALDTWTDDFPYYSDGSWGALSLRGFNPADPQWGIKPAEMSKAWWAEHPEARQLNECKWTVLAEACPATVDLVRSVGWWGELERVRLLRMAGRDGKGGSLSRHTDITDRAAGTRDGQIVRFHIPLITHERITMSAWNLRGERFNAHLPPWSMWYLDARKPHAVDNKAGIDRIHLVVDVVADTAARQAIVHGADVAA